jgi:hypothetical protein
MTCSIATSTSTAPISRAGRGWCRRKKAGIGKKERIHRSRQTVPDPSTNSSFILSDPSAYMFKGDICALGVVGQIKNIEEF